MGSPGWGLGIIIPRLQEERVTRMDDLFENSMFDFRGRRVTVEL